MTALARMRTLRWTSNGDPWWVYTALLAILGLAAALYTRAMQHIDLTVYYSGAVRSMSQSWRAFFFGSLDPAGWLTVDKLPGAFWVQALTVRVFGFSTWALVGPQVVEGLLIILVTHRAVRLHSGPVAGLTAAVVVLAMPVSTALARGNVPDTAATLLTVLAASATLRAASSNRARSLALAAVWIGLAFQAKMVQAWLIWPVCAAVYLIAAPSAPRTRLIQVASATVVMIVVSLSWMTVVSFTPSGHRPWFDGSNHDSVFEQVFVYNGVARFKANGNFGIKNRDIAADGARLGPSAPASPSTTAGAPPSNSAGSASTAGAAGAAQQPTVTPQNSPARAKAPSHFVPVSTFHTDPSWSRLLYGGFAMGVGWLLPLAALSGLALLSMRRRRPRTDLVRAAVLLWLTWLIGYTMAFSMLHHVNAYYPGVIVPAIGALVGTGATWAWQASRERRTWWVFPAALSLGTGYSVVLLNVAGPNWSWLRTAVGALGALASVLYLGSRRPSGAGSRTGATPFIALLALAAVLTAPAIGSLATVGNQSGPYTFAFSQSGIGSFGEPAGQSLAARYRRPVAKLLDYIEPRTLGEHYLIATGGADEAAALIAATGRPVLPIGGYSGEMPIPNSTEISKLIADHQLRFVSIEPRSNDVRLIWVLQTCRLIPGYETQSDISPRQARLYDCLGSTPLTGARAGPLGRPRVS